MSLRVSDTYLRHAANSALMVGFIAPSILSSGIDDRHWDRYNSFTWK